jgi:hypothetical protein
MAGHPGEKTFTQTLMKKIWIWTFLGFEKCPKPCLTRIVLGMRFLKVVVTKVRSKSCRRPSKNALLTDFEVPKCLGNFWTFFGNEYMEEISSIWRRFRVYGGVFE